MNTNQHIMKCMDITIHRKTEHSLQYSINNYIMFCKSQSSSKTINCLLRRALASGMSNADLDIVWKFFRLSGEM